MGYGVLLTEGLFTSRRLPAEKARDDTAEGRVPPSELSTFDSAIESQKQLIRDTILGQPNDVLLSSPTAIPNVNVFAANFRLSPITVNDDIDAANFLNQRILSRPSSGDIPSVPFWLTSIELSQIDYDLSPATSPPPFPPFEIPLPPPRHHRPCPQRTIPFYIYGTLRSAHIDHILLRAPNLQLSVDLLSLDELRGMVEEKVFEEELRRGAVIRLVGVSETTMPVDEESARGRFLGMERSCWRGGG
ncbi:hypothetical protein BDD12DRAFT_893580 [Trichophaea hybrida]|nr:hypothetical protein BDD12DRAFT_893580 [Trichophaea hybrida]